MNSLPNDCAFIIAQKILAGLPKPQHPVAAANLRLVGNEDFTTIAENIWEILEPGCTKKAYKDYDEGIRSTISSQ
jgi:hypothetical protein